MTLTSEDYEIVESSDNGLTVLFKKAGYSDFLVGVRPVADGEDVAAVLAESYPFAHFGLSEPLLDAVVPDEILLASKAPLGLFKIEVTEV